MSLSLEAVQADGYYMPTDFDWRKHKSVNHYHGIHPLRERARKLGQGILIIRFEMPFNVWCGGCGKHIAKGERFNAEKKQVGTYHSTKIYSFTFNTACCQSKITIETDPANYDYRIVTGAMRKTESYSARDAQTEELQTKEHRERLRQDPTYRLEHDRTRADAIAEGSMRLNEIMRETEARHGREDDVNRMLRKRMREARRDEHRRDGHKRSLGIAEGIKLLPSGREEREVASLVMNAGLATKSASHSAVERRRQISRSSIFSKTGSGGVKAGQSAKERLLASLAPRGGQRKR